MIALLLAQVLLLRAPDVPLWVERDGETLRLTAEVGPLLDDALRRRLTSGLTTTLRLQIDVRHHDSGQLRGVSWRIARARWDLWEERLTVEVDEPGGARTATFPSVDAFAADFGRVDGEPVAQAVPEDETVYQLVVTLDVNPLSTEQMARMRRWLIDPQGASALDPLSSGLLGSFVRFFDNLKPGVAEHTVQVTGHPFRGDRLPHRRGP